jgi:hypothetical protein
MRSIPVRSVDDLVGDEHPPIALDPSSVVFPTSDIQNWRLRHKLQTIVDRSL